MFKKINGKIENFKKKKKKKKLSKHDGKYKKKYITIAKNYIAANGRGNIYY